MKKRERKEHIIADLFALIEHQCCYGRVVILKSLEVGGLRSKSSLSSLFLAIFIYMMHPTWAGPRTVEGCAAGRHFAAKCGEQGFPTKSTPWTCKRELLSRAFSARNAYWRPRAAYLGLAQQGRRACAVKLTKKEPPGFELETLSSCTSVPNHQNNLTLVLY